MDFFPPCPAVCRQTEFVPDPVQPPPKLRLQTDRPPIPVQSRSQSTLQTGKARNPVRLPGLSNRPFSATNRFTILSRINWIPQYTVKSGKHCTINSYQKRPAPRRLAGGCAGALWRAERAPSGGGEIRRSSRRMTGEDRCMPGTALRLMR